MDIRNVTQFANFLSANGLNTKDSIFIQLINCINTFKSACNCYKKEDKLEMYRRCNKLYNDAVKHVIPKIKNDILSKSQERQISFYDESGRLLSTISR